MRFCGLFVSDHRHSRCAVARIQSFCGSVDERFRGRLGVGYYSGREVLLVRRPVGPDLNLASMVGTANHFLFSLDDPTASQFRPEATPPYRFRNWLGLWKVGPVRQQGFADRLLFHVPEYIARDLKGDTPPELMFHLFLSYLHDMTRVSAQEVPVQVLIEALRSTLLLFPKLLGLGPAESPPPVAACISNGQHMVAAAVGTDMWMHSSGRIDACPLCSETERTPHHDPRIVSHEGIRVVSFAHMDSDKAPEGFTAVPEGQLVAATDAGEVISRGLA